MRIDLEAEYNNRARVPEHAGIIAGWASDAAAYRAAHPPALQSRLAYGGSSRQFIDVFTPAALADGSKPVLFIHGGYWQGLDPSFFSHLAQGLNAHGITVGVVGYDLCPDVTVSDIIGQMRAAAVALAKALGVSNTVVCGHSAGGHLAACLAATDWPAIDPAFRADLVSAGLAISGLFELEPLLPTTVNHKLGLDVTAARAASPRLWDPPSGVVFDAWVGGDESAEYLRQSETLAAVWSGAGNDCRRVVVEGANHFTVIAGLAEPGSAMTRRLRDVAAA